MHIDTDNDPAGALHSHWDVHNPTFPVLTGCASILGQYGNGYIPYNVIIDPNGVVRFTDSGFNESQIRNIVNSYLPEPGPVVDVDAVSVVADDNGDSRPDGGETVELSLDLSVPGNCIGGVEVSARLDCDHPAVTVESADVDFPDLGAGDSASGLTNFIVSIANDIAPDWAELTFTCTISDGEESFEYTRSFPLRIGRPDMLVFDSDGGADDNEVFMTSVLDELGMEYDVASSAQLTPLATEEFARYETIFWLGGSNEDDLTADERVGLGAFLAQGGFLIFSSQYASDDPDNAQFIADAFDVTTVDTDGGSIFLVYNEETDPWFGGSAFMATGTQGANNNEEPDVLELGPSATLLGHWGQGDEGPAAAYVIRPAYHAIYMGFPVEATRIHNSVTGSMNMSMFLERAFAFHEAAVAVDEVPAAAPAAWRLLDAAPNPFNPTTTLRYELRTSGDVQLRIFNALGQQVDLLQPGQLNPGTHESVFDGSSLASGLYLVELAVDGTSRDALKLMLLK